MFDIIPYKKSHRVEITQMLGEFYHDSLNDYGLKMTHSIEKFEGKFMGFVLTTNGKAIGIIAGMISNQIMSDKIVFQEVLWYVDKGYRGRGIALLNHLENWCKGNGVDNIVMAYTHNSVSKMLSSLYERKGYKPFETHLIKDITNG